ncbi:hypothetical protein [uncultured Desulfobacter sp.]|uniref:hypothetical protein n=1 Tax=uncultured Desulfobacter sp. TaxID=240139 RepID=UPI0029F4F56D|nr:hypothetical protein [uncultured Desulfobacter sp.]
MYRVYARIVSGIICLSVLTGAGCIAVPYQEFKTYDQAFTETKTATEKFLLEYDTELEERNKAQEKTKSAGDGTPFPATVNLAPVMNPSKATTPLTARYDALSIVSDFNTVLITLAEGKSSKEVQTVADSLISSLNKFGTLIGETELIPYAAPVGKLVSTLIQKLNEAQNRKQFIAALTAGEPVVQAILDLFAQDAQDIYKVKALKATGKCSDYQDKAAAFNRQIKSLSRDYKIPSDNKTITRIKKVEAEMQKIYTRTGLKNKAVLDPQGKKPFGDLVFSQFEQTLVQAGDAATGYETVIKEQQAFYELSISYGRLLGKTKTALTTVRLALDKPADIHQQATDLIAFVFEVKRDWNALEKARQSGSGQ